MPETEFPRRTPLKLSDKSNRSYSRVPPGGRTVRRSPIWTSGVTKNQGRESPPAVYQTVSLSSSVNKGDGSLRIVLAQQRGPESSSSLGPRPSICGLVVCAALGLALA